jgi:hypothetical protein
MAWETYLNFFVSYRRWLLERIRKDLEAQAEAVKSKQQGVQLTQGNSSVSLPTGGARKF